MPHHHPNLSAEVPGLNRAIGQLEAVKRMIADGKYCVDVMIQLRAARNALKSIELNVLEAHMGACVAEAFAGRDETLKAKKITEIRDLLAKYE